MKDNNIEELKRDNTIAPMIEENRIELYRIKILNRGEHLFYFDKKKNKALIVEIQIRNGSIFDKSIKKWDDNESIKNTEKKIILDRIVNYFQVFQKKKAFIR